MAVDRKYGKVEIPGIAEDEPVFIIRAQDVLAIPTLVRYQNFRLAAEETPPSPEWQDHLESVIDDFETWKGDNADKMKLPD